MCVCVVITDVCVCMIKKKTSSKKILNINAKNVILQALVQKSMVL